MVKSKSAYSVPGKIGKTERHIIVVWVDNEAGVLARIAGLFSGRGYNIESLAVAEVDKKKHISRITIVTEGTPQVIEQINLQLKKLVPVHKVADFKRGEKDILFRELALFKILGNSKKLEKVKTVPYKHNYGYLFTSGPDTWHGMEKKKIVKERRCIQVNYVTFKTDWKVD